MRPGLLVFVLAALLILYGAAIGYLSVSVTLTATRLTKTEAKQAAQEAAAEQAEVTVCRRQVATGPTTLVILESLRDVIADRVATSQQARLADPDSPLDDVRQRAIQRGQVALDGLQKFVVQTRRRTPTDARCDALAAKYGIGQSNQKEDK